ncbi:hypothetical protein JB92DRAFT_2826361 [Gautieria morchelliformis]|nr:hypothetical protein JB92DRAFT_2826361 [Gautieria morchelliformis]
MPTSPCTAVPAPHRKLPAHYSPFMAAIAFPPKLDYAHCQEIRAFRNMGQSNGNYSIREQGRERERGREIGGNNSGGNGGDGRRRDTGTPITTHSGSNRVRSTPTLLGRQAAAGQGHATTCLPRLASTTGMPQIVTEMDTPWISGS